MDATGKVAGAICGPLAFLFFGLAFSPLVANFLPPTSPALDAAAIARLYQEQGGAIRIASVLMLTAAALLCAFTATLSSQIREITPQRSPLAYTQLVAGSMVVLTFMAAALFFALASFRPDRSPETIQLLNDAAWMFFVMPGQLGLIQLLPVGWAILADRRAEPALPRWLGYMTIWVAILLLPGFFIVFFKTGPFAWNGLITFWIPAIAFGNWVPLICIAMIKAARKSNRAETASASRRPPFSGKDTSPFE